jgi:hypothetical protein
MSSFLKVANQLSETALSQPSPLRPTDNVTPSSPAKAAKSRLVY